MPGRRSRPEAFEVACALALVMAGFATGRAVGQENEAPAIQHDPPACGRGLERTRLCAYVVDDRGIAQVRLSFRARGARAYHWTPMAFDGALYCAWLPAPLAATNVVDYYVEAIDGEFEPSRTADHSLAISSDCPTAAQQAPDAPAVVATTVPGQPPSPDGFDPGTFKTR